MRNEQSDEPRFGEQYLSGFHYDNAPQLYPEISGDRNSSLECRTFSLFLSLYRPGLTVVDMGCGTGRVGRHVGKALNPGRLVYMELSEREIALAKQLDSHPGRSFIRADVLNAPLRPGSCQYLTCHGVVHHTPDSRGALGSIAAALAPGGLLYLAVYSKSWYALLYPLFRLLRAIRNTRLSWITSLAYWLYYPLRWALRVRETGQIRKDFNIRASFEDFVMTPFADFHSDAEMRERFASGGLDVLDHEMVNYRTLHCYVLQKRQP